MKEEYQPSTINKKRYRRKNENSYVPVSILTFEQEILYNLNTSITFGGEGEEGSETEKKMWGEGKDATYHLKVLIARVLSSISSTLGVVYKQEDKIMRDKS